VSIFDITSLYLRLEIDRYHFLIPIFSKKFHRYGQFPIFDWSPILIFQNLLIDIFSDVLTKNFGQSWYELLAAYNLTNKKCKVMLYWQDMKHLLNEFQWISEVFT